jgi:hypothetical protein
VCLNSRLFGETICRRDYFFPLLDISIPANTKNQTGMKTYLNPGMEGVTVLLIIPQCLMANHDTVSSELNCLSCPHAMYLVLMLCS